jgi:hypothetical protein
MQFARFIVPYLEKISKKLLDISKWVRDNEQVIKSFLIAIAIVISATLIPTILKLAATWLIGFAPLIAIIALLALMIDDFMMWKAGKKSVLGELLGSFEEFEKKLKKFTEGFLKDLKDDLEYIWKRTKWIRDALWDAVKALGKFSFEGWVEGIKAFVGWMEKLIELKKELEEQEKGKAETALSVGSTVISDFERFLRRIFVQGVHFVFPAAGEALARGFANLEELEDSIAKIIYYNPPTKIQEIAFEENRRHPKGQLFGNTTTTTINNNDNRSFTVNIDGFSRGTYGYMRDNELVINFDGLHGGD